MKRISLLVVALLICGLSASQAEAAILVLQPPDGKDAEIDPGQPDTNFGNEPFLITNWGRITNRGLIEFDLSSLTGATINSATLGIYQITNSVPGAEFGIYRTTSPWSESTVTWNGQPSTVAIPDSTLTISDGFWEGWREWQVSALVQGWVSGSYNNYGMMLARTGAGLPPYMPYFASSDSSYKPKLTIDYTPIPEPASLSLLGLGLLGLLGLRKRRV